MQSTVWEGVLVRKVFRQIKNQEIVVWTVLERKVVVVQVCDILLIPLVQPEADVAVNVVLPLGV